MTQHARLRHVTLKRGAQGDWDIALGQDGGVAEVAVVRFHAAAHALHGRIHDHGHMGLGNRLGHQVRLGGQVEHGLQLELLCQA